MKNVSKNIKVKINEFDYYFVRCLVLKRLMKLKQRENSLLILCQTVPHPKNSFARLFNCQEEIRKIEYIVKNY